MNFIKTIQNSIYSPSFYKGIPKKTLWQSIKYFLLLVLLLTVLGTIFLIPSLFIETPILLQNLAKDTLNCFPNELEIKISKGEVTTNVSEPYFVNSSSCTTFTEIADTANAEFTFAVIDTKTPFSQVKFEEYNSMVWLTRDSVAVKDREDATRLYSLKQADNFILNKQSLDSFYNKFAPYLNFVGPVLLALAFLAIFIVYLFRLLQLLLTASLIWLLGKIFRHGLNFSSSYKIGLYGATLGLIVEFIVNSTNRWTNFSGFPFMFTVITLGVVVVNVFLTKPSSEGVSKS